MAREDGVQRQSVPERGHAAPEEPYPPGPGVEREEEPGVPGVEEAEQAPRGPREEPDPAEDEPFGVGRE